MDGVIKNSDVRNNNEIFHNTVVFIVPAMEMIVDWRLELGGVCHDGSKYYSDIYSRHGTAHRGKDNARVSPASLVASGPCKQYRQCVFPSNASMITLVFVCEPVTT